MTEPATRYEATDLALDALKEDVGPGNFRLAGPDAGRVVYLLGVAMGMSRQLQNERDAVLRLYAEACATIAEERNMHERTT